MSTTSKGSLAVPDGSNGRSSCWAARSLTESRVMRSPWTPSGLFRSKSVKIAAKRAESTGGQYSFSSSCMFQICQQLRKQKYLEQSKRYIHLSDHRCWTPCRDTRASRLFRARRGRVHTAALLAPKRVPAQLSKKMWSHSLAQARSNDENQKGGSQRATREDNLAIDGMGR